jgi:hypothetical protein
MRRMELTRVVLPTPGPPVKTRLLARDRDQLFAEAGEAVSGGCSVVARSLEDLQVKLTSVRCPKVL